MVRIKKLKIILPIVFILMSVIITVLILEDLKQVTSDGFDTAIMLYSLCRIVIFEGLVISSSIILSALIKQL